MKTIRKFQVSLFIALFVFASCQTAMSGTEKKNKIQIKMEEAANKINANGGVAVTAIAVYDVARSDIGILQAEINARSAMARAGTTYVENSIHDAIDKMGNKAEGIKMEGMDGFVKIVAAQLQKNAKVMDNNFFRAKSDKKNGTATYIVLLAISPKDIAREIEKAAEKEGAENKNFQELYQRFLKENLQKQHEEEMKKWEEMMSKEK
jgi:hypothetical protein